MIQTPRMWEISQRINSLAYWVKADPNDYMSRFELEELHHEYNKLERIEKLGLKLILGFKTTDKVDYKLSKHLKLVHDSDLESA
jgi:hypothetical protein